ncbi:hypothetical protein ABNG03_18635 [Halorubrum sp. RMP-47]|uniref:Uncharacterized protein n=1 Tax=Halorubrum miltondacostae TaxID=3076378 RepID=A0ABD5M4U7_9EURY
MDTVVYPERAGARVAANRVARKEVETLAAVAGGIEVPEITVAEGAPTAGRTLTDIAFSEGTSVITDEDGNTLRAGCGQYEGLTNRSVQVTNFLATFRRTGGFVGSWGKRKELA